MQITEIVSFEISQNLRIRSMLACYVSLLDVQIDTSVALQDVCIRF